MCFHGRWHYAPWFACATCVPIVCRASATVPRKRYLLPQIFRHEIAITCEHTMSTNTVKDRWVVSRLLVAHSYPDSGGSSFSLPHTRSSPPAIRSPPFRSIVHGQDDFVAFSVAVKVLALRCTLHAQTVACFLMRKKQNEHQSTARSRSMREREVVNAWICPRKNGEWTHLCRR